MIALMIMLLSSDNGRVVWFAALIYFCLELYAITPFGILFASGTLSMLFLVWIYRSLFTNRSLVAAAALTAVGLFLYRVLYSIGIFMVSSEWDWNAVLTTYGFEFIVSVPTGALIYAIISRLLTQLKIGELPQP